jgi:hypothetical protein
MPALSALRRWNRTAGVWSHSPAGCCLLRRRRHREMECGRGRGHRRRSGRQGNGRGVPETPEDVSMLRGRVRRQGSSGMVKRRVRHRS